jgi:phosphoketolase
MAAEAGRSRATACTTWTLTGAANYLSVGQIYLMANPLLAGPLRAEHIKPRLLGHWGTSPA